MSFTFRSIAKASWLWKTRSQLIRGLSFRSQTISNGLPIITPFGKGSSGFSTQPYRQIASETANNVAAKQNYGDEAQRARRAEYEAIPIEGAQNELPYLLFGRLWLRDNCQCSKCIHPDTLQRASDTFSIPEDVKADDIRLSHDGKVLIDWNDGHKAIYSLEWLVAHQQNKIAEDKRNHGPKTNELKDLPSIKKGTVYKCGDPYPKVQYEDVMSNDSFVSDWLEKIYDMGFCFIEGVPINPDATKALIERIAFIRHTHYGGFWDFTADLTFKDTAYTNEALGGHTDNTYFTDPARLQLFHLLSHTDGDGGHNLLVDAFEAARVLLSEDASLFRSLDSERHPFHASGNEDVCIQPSARAPVLNIHPDTGALYQVRWNNYDRAPKTDWAVEDQKVWYKAARRYNELLNQPSSQVWTQLKPGTALIFDNWRMLHGRSEFTGKRRMCGGYVNNDDFISRLRLLKYGREKVLKYLGVVSDEEGNPNSVY